MNDVFKSEEDGYWYYWDDESMAHGPFESAGEARICKDRGVTGVLMESLGRDA